MLRQQRERAAFGLVGLFLLCMASLMVQLVQIRLISVIAWYYLAFFGVSMAMLGMAAGSLLVYLRPGLFPEARIPAALTWASLGFAASVVVSTLGLISTVLPAGIQPAYPAVSNIPMRVVLWLKLILVVTPPYVFAGVITCLCLTRTRWRVSTAYAADLLGAASGSLLALLVQTHADPVSALLVAAGVGAAAAVCFALSARGSGPRPQTPVAVAAALAGAAWLNAGLQPSGLGPMLVKDRFETGLPAAQQWNAFSRVRVEPESDGAPAMWGPSPKMPPMSVRQHYLNIDGAAGTALYRFGDDLESLSFLRYDITNLAYAIRHGGLAAIIGVGGGRDLLSAHLFRFDDVTGIEVNGIFIDLLTGPFRNYSRLASLPGTRLVVDDGRSWFARTRARFDLIQMSLVDTWAATGAGALSLSENGLYTVQAWHHFLDALRPGGVFTVSRWFDAHNVSETGRLLSLALAALSERGIMDPRPFLYLAASERLATLLVSNQAFTADDLATLHRRAGALDFVELVSPDRDIASPLLQDVAAARGPAALATLSARHHIDLTAPTDDRPFFFNQLLLTDPQSLQIAREAGFGVLHGNLEATETVVVILVISAALVSATLIGPALPSVRPVPLRLAASGTAYFGAIGLGFMFLEMGMIQRASILLGHPVYGIAIGLCGIILSTGLGSLLAERFRPASRLKLLAWGAAVGLFGVLPAWSPWLVVSLEGQALWIRALASLATIAPAGLLMGLGFPTGAALVRELNDLPMPWFWAVNGMCGVLGAGLSVALSIALSISASFLMGWACYLIAAMAGCMLIGLRRKIDPELDETPLLVSPRIID